jgi:NAD-dependent SIR2 family protein deacetylase
METIHFYCQHCGETITVEQLGTLDEGRCPECQSMEGFSTAPKSASDPFDTVMVINDTEMLEKVWETKS